MFAHTTADLRVGMALELDQEPVLVQHFQHVKPGKGAAFVRTKLRVRLCSAALYCIALGI